MRNAIPIDGPSVMPVPVGLTRKLVTRYGHEVVGDASQFRDTEQGVVFRFTSYPLLDDHLGRPMHVFEDEYAHADIVVEMRWRTATNG